MTVKLGRLKSVGITELWQVALYCPLGYKDYSRLWPTLDPQTMPIGQIALFKVSLIGNPQTEWKDKKPRTTFNVTDGEYQTIFSLFGDVRSTVEELTEKQWFYISGVPHLYSEKVYLNEVKIISESDIGKVVPVYPGKSGKITPDNVRLNIEKHLDDAVPLSSMEIRKKLTKHFKTNLALREYIQCHSMTLDMILIQLHRPDSIESAYGALGIITKIANIVAADTLLNRATDQSITNVPALNGMGYKDLIAKIPFTLTNEQKSIVADAVKTMQRGEMLTALISGDVGTGKTVVYAIIAGFVASAGGRVAVLLPNENLTNQIYEEILSYFSHLDFGIGIITANKEVNPKANIIIGTSALLHRNMGELALVICDEQQKMATGQREQLRGKHTHLIEVSATPIPRTMALATYGAIKVFKITKCHAEKTIHTRVFHKKDNAQMMKGVMDTINSGMKVLVVCPKRENNPDKEDGLMSAQELANKFEPFAPGRVVLSHAGLSAEENEKAIKDIKEGGASILISTTVTEVGMTIPNLCRVVVVHAERFGLQTIHQIRGRLVRHGGVGFCDLYLPKEVKNPNTMVRLKLLEDIIDGFELARQDMKCRGIGDITQEGETQHGAVNVMIKNIECNMGDIDTAVETILALRMAS